VNDELEGIWKDAIEFSFNIPFQSFLPGSEENHEHFLSRQPVYRPKSGLHDTNLACLPLQHAVLRNK
jgi:hypothetical protein